MTTAALTNFVLAGTDEIFQQINVERLRQVLKFGDQSIAGSVSDLTRLRILVEEVGEVAEALDVEHANTKRELCAELVQVAACAVGWLQALQKATT